MKPKSVIQFLLLAAFIVGDLALITYVESANHRWPDVAGIVLLGLGFGQITLVSAWFVFASWNIAIRVLIALAAIFGLAMVAGTATDGPNSVTPWFAIQLVAFGATVAPLAVARCLRWRINPDLRAKPGVGIPVWQFSIWGLLSGTTAVAIALGTARQVSMPLLDVAEAAAFFACLIAIGLIVFFATMGIKPASLALLVSIPVLAVICPLGGLLMGKSGLPPSDHVMQMTVCGFFYGATVAAAACVLRIAGLQLSRVPLVEDADLPDQPVDKVTIEIRSFLEEKSPPPELKIVTKPVDD